MRALPSPRLPLVDALRGFAVAQMIVYHFIYDLNYFGHLELAMTRDQPWVGWRTAIVTQFLLLVGAAWCCAWPASPAGATSGGAGRRCRGGSAGVAGQLADVRAALHLHRHPALHRRGAAGRPPAVPLREWNFVLAAAVFAAWWFYRDPAFNAAPANIVGFVTAKPRTEDYVPLFPWLAAVLAGIGLGSLWQRRGFALTPFWQRLNDRPPRLLVLAGTWALTVYLVHQPVMITALWLLRRLA